MAGNRKPVNVVKQIRKATAFCNYYGHRLPTELKWQAVADFDASYGYGCGTSINAGIANYVDSTHPDGTTIVIAFATYGYGMCDMAGNVVEWTSTFAGSYPVARSSFWGNSAININLNPIVYRSITK